MPQKSQKPRTREQLQKELDRLQKKIAALERASEEQGPREQPQQGDDSRFRKLFESAKDGMVLTESVSGRIVQVNNAFLRMTGHPGEALVGRLLWEIEPLKATDAGLVAVRELQQDDHIYYDDLPLLRKDGTETSIELTCTAHRQQDERIIQCTFRDISSRKALEADLWRFEARFRALFQHAHVGIAFVDRAGRIVDNNRALEEMLGYGENELRGKDYGSFSLPEDRSAEHLLFQDVTSGHREAYHLTVRNVRRDGAELWGLVGVTGMHGAEHHSPLIIRIVEDITDRKRAEEMIIRSRDFYRALLNELPNPIRLADTEGHCDYFNRAWRSFTGKRMERELGEGWTDSIHDDDRDGVTTLLRESISRRRPFTTEYRLRNQGGDYHWIVEFGSPFSDMNGAFAGYVSSCYDIHERKTLEDTLKSITITDDLTGLLNRRGFFALAQQQVKIANRTQRGLMLLFGDLDGLKTINDTHGHHAGDQALIETSALLREVFRESDIIARLGGDEFAVLMTDEGGATKDEIIYARLRDAIEQRNAVSAEPYDLQLSAGIKRYDPNHPMSLDRLVSDADGLMYEEKKRKKTP